MRYWPFPIMRNYRTSEDLSMIFLRFAKSKNLRVLEQSTHEITVTCEHGDLHFWCENAYFAWANNGWYEPVGGRRKKWVHEMPSRYAVRAMRQALNFQPQRFLLAEAA